MSRTSRQRALRVFFLTLGCPKNEVDTDRMKAAIAASSHEYVDDAEDADVVVVNTCSFIQDAADESIAAVLDTARDWVPVRTGRRLVVAGCLASRYGTDLADAMPEVDAFVPVAEEHALVEVLDRLTGASADRAAPDGVHLAGPPAAPQRTASGPSAYLQISDGCHRRCSYCTIPAIRGPYRSRPLAEIVEEARFLVGMGARELTLVGQDISSYGRDLGNDAPALPDVVRAVARVDDLAWLRLMYVQPDGVTDELLDVMAHERAVCHYLDIPLQHVSPTVLRRMKRRGSASQFLALIERIRGVMPDVVLRTSLIAGFPGETRADVTELETFLATARIDYAGVFAYSPEEGTPAASFAGLPDKRTRVRRANRMRDAADRIGFEKAAERVGMTLEVLVEGIEDGDVVGRWCGQAPEVDGLVLLDRGTPGEFVEARVLDTLGYDLEAEVL